MCSSARQAELEDRDLIKHIVGGLNDTSGITASLYFCESLDLLRRRFIEYDQIRLSLPNSIWKCLPYVLNYFIAHTPKSMK